MGVGADAASSSPQRLPKGLGAVSRTPSPPVWLGAAWPRPSALPAPWPCVPPAPPASSFPSGAPAALRLASALSQAVPPCPPASTPLRCLSPASRGFTGIGFRWAVRFICSAVQTRVPSSGSSAPSRHAVWFPLLILAPPSPWRPPAWTRWRVPAWTPGHVPTGQSRQTRCRWGAAGGTGCVGH